MVQRKVEVEQTKLVQRAMALPRVDRHAVHLAVSLLVVREFGLPDSAADILLDNDQCPWQEERQERVLIPCHVHRPPIWRSPEVARSRQQAIYHHHSAQPFCPIHDRYQVIILIIL